MASKKYLSRFRRRSGRRKGVRAMSEKLINNLHELSDSIIENSPRVETKLSSDGTKPDPAVVTSAAKYHRARELLAKE